MEVMNRCEGRGEKVDNYYPISRSSKRYDEASISHASTEYLV